jgi:hypothetical protein
MNLQQQSHAAIPKIRRTGKLCRKGHRMPLTIPELRTAASFLRQAKVHVESALDYFRGENPTRSAKLGENSARLSGKNEAIERLIGKLPNGSGKNG